jgi:DNA-directed RNA polymerase specialized sigma24 family protein
MTWEDLKDESTADLIDYIRYKDEADYTELAESAFIVFTFRFRKEIIDKCRKIGRYWRFDTTEADTIAEEVFERFWRYPTGFDTAECRNADINKCVLYYLFTIARNCFADHSKERERENMSPYDGTETVVVEFPALENLELSEDRVLDLKRIAELMSNALNSLSDKHRIIYLTYKAYEKEGYKLPRQLLKKLREETRLKQPSIRVYKKEAFDTIEQIFKDYGSK